MAGIVSAIIAGFVFPFLGGAYVTISGPAAGLAPALLAGMLLLGDGDLAAGYPLLLVAICLTGLVQVVLSLFKAGKLVAMFLPVTVVEAMLAAGLTDYLRAHPGFYLEIRDNALLAFRPQREIEEPDEAGRWLFTLAELLARRARNAT